MSDVNQTFSHLIAASAVCFIFFVAHNLNNMISSLVQGYGSEDDASDEGKEEDKKHEEKETERKEEEEEEEEEEERDDKARERHQRRRRRPLSVPSAFEKRSRNFDSNNNRQEKRKEEVSAEIQARVEKYLEAKRTTHLNINSQLREPKGFRNPSFLQSVVEHFGVKQDGSELPGRRNEKEQEEEEDLYENIAARQRAEAEVRLRTRKNISFVQQKEENYGADTQELIDKAREQARLLNARMAAKQR